MQRDIQSKNITSVWLQLTSEYLSEERAARIDASTPTVASGVASILSL